MRASIRCGTLACMSMLMPHDWPTVRRFGGRTMLWTARIHAGLSQDELGALVGATRRTISVIERGRSTPSLSLAVALARSLDLTVEELFPADDER